MAIFVNDYCYMNDAKKYLQPAKSLRRKSGFTLIELSIVLVIIGLIVGGVLVGQDLIKAAGVRAQISQIGQYNTAANTFEGKYGYLPGDISATSAGKFGFAARGTARGQGDGNGVIEGTANSSYATDGWDCFYGGAEGAGETVLFWRDLAQAGLIEGSFTSATATGEIYLTGNFSAYFPPAKLSGNYVYVFSGATTCSYSVGDGFNYFGIANITGIGTAINSNEFVSGTGISVQQAYNIDKKIDDGYPQSGAVQAFYANFNVTSVGTIAWSANGGSNFGTGTEGDYAAPGTSATPGSSTTCYDNNNTGGANQQYSVGQNGGNGINCALSFKFQ